VCGTVLPSDRDMFTTAKLKLPDFIKEKHRKKRPVGAPVTFGDARKLYVADLDIHVLDRSLDDNRPRKWINDHQSFNNSSTK